MRALLILREDTRVFGCLMKIIDYKLADFSGKSVTRLAEDLVLLFFADFSSTDKNIASFLRQLEVLLERLFSGVTKNEFPLLFDEDLMINRIIKIYLNKYEHREYLRLLFDKIFIEAIDLRKYLNELKQKQQKNDVEFELIQNDGITNYTNDSTYNGENNADGLYSPQTRIISDHFSSGTKQDLGNLQLKKVEEQKSSSYSTPGNFFKMTTEEILLICDGIISRITRKLPYMPLSIRYLCKLLEKCSIQYGNKNPNLSTRKIIMDILFNKWWLLAFMKPSENGLLRNCANENSFILQLKPVVKVLKAVLYDKSIDGVSTESTLISSFVTSKKYF